jgi:hypothetical protein
MNHKKHNIEDDDETTIWKNQKYFIPNTSNNSSSIRTNDFNYTNIQLPSLDGFIQLLTQNTSGASLSSVEPFTREGDTSSSIFKGETTASYFGDSNTVPPLTIAKTPDLRSIVGVRGLSEDGLPSNDNLTDIDKLYSDSLTSLTDNPTKSTNKYSNFVDYEFTKPDVNFDIGLNAKETRVNIPPILPDEVEMPEELPDAGSVRNVDVPDADDANETVDKQKRNISTKWNTFYRNKTLTNAKKLAVSVVENVPEMFAIPETISEIIVKHATDKSKRKGIDYAQNVLKVNLHFKSFIAILLCLYITFNWWYLMLYTNHYIDFYSLLKLPIFTPLIWIIGPLITPIAALNYYLLGKRTEPEFYKKYIEPILKKKSFYLSMLFITTVVLYEPIIQLFATNMKDILGESDKMNPLVAIVVAFAVLSFLYSVVFNTERNIQFIETVSFLIAIVAYLIMFILVIMMAKPVSILVIIYLVFYLFLFLLVAENVNFVGKIIEMMSDTTEQCLDNSSSSTWSKLMNVCYRYSFFILVFIVLFVRICHALYDVQTITNERVRVSCYAIYLSLLIVFLLLMGYNFIDVMMNVKQIITGEGKGDIPDNEDEFDEDDPDISFFGKLVNGVVFTGKQIRLLVLILWEALQYIVIQLARVLTFPFRFLYRNSTEIISLINPFGKNKTPLTPTQTPPTPVNIEQTPIQESSPVTPQPSIQAPATTPQTETSPLTSNNPPSITP